MLAIVVEYHPQHEQKVISPIESRFDLRYPSTRLNTGTGDLQEVKLPLEAFLRLYPTVFSSYSPDSQATAGESHYEQNGQN